MRDPREETIPQENGSGFNRRDFLRGSGAAVAVTALATSDQGAAAQDAAKKNVASAKAQDLTLSINGKDHKLSLEPRVTLLAALRDDLNRCLHGADRRQADLRLQPAGDRVRWQKSHDHRVADGQRSGRCGLREA